MQGWLDFWVEISKHLRIRPPGSEGVKVAPTSWSVGALSLIASSWFLSLQERCGERCELRSEAGNPVGAARDWGAVGGGTCSCR